MTETKILIIEDEIIVAKQIETWLTNLGYVVSAITDTGADALQKTADTNPNLILIDIKLKGDIDGITVAEQIHKEYDIPVIYLTAYSDDETLQRAKITEPYGYLTKPFAPKELHSTIQMALYKHQMEKNLRISEQRYRSLFNGIPVGLYRTTPQGDILDANLAMAQMLGYPDQESLRTVNVIQDLIDPATHQQWQERLSKEKVVQGFELQIRKKDGSFIWVEDNARLVTDNKGNSYYEGSIKDITNRKQTKEYLQDNVQELKIAYQQSIIYAQELTGEITERRRAEKEIRELNEELEERVAQRTRDLSVLYEITMVASNFLDQTTMLARSLEQVLLTIKRDIGVIHLIDKAQEMLTLAAHQGVSEVILAAIETVPLDNKLIVWIIENSETLLIPDIRNDARLPTIDIPLKEQYSYLALPLRAGGRVLGTLGIVGKESQPFNAEEVALLASVADQFGVAVENARLRQQAEHAAVIEERERLARELHDSVTQSLYSLSLFAEAGENLIENGDLDSARHNLKRMGETSQQALKEMRLLVYQLRPLDLEKEGLIGALHQRLSAVEGRVNIKARLVAEELVELPPLLEEELYRIAQEALNNALKHAAATTVTIYLNVEDEQVELEIVDDGKGFEPEAVGDLGGIGLLSMQERTEKLGGTFTITSAPNQGTRIKVSVTVTQTV